MNHNHVRTISITLVVLAAMAMAGYFLKRTFDVPGDAVDKGFEIADKSIDRIGKLAAAVNTQTIKADFTSTATTLAGTSRLQVTTIKQVELFERLDSVTWGGVRFPDVIVNAKAPVEYTFFLDLNGEWNFSWDDKTMTVLAPPIEFNTPAIDASALEYQVIKGSVLRNEEAVKEALRKTLTEQSKKRAADNIHIAREAARREVEKFVRKFVGQAYGVGESLPVIVRFRDEAAAAVQVENPTN